MRLNVPPTLKQSSLMDSHSLSMNSPINLNSRGFKKSSKVYKEDSNTQFGEDMTIGEIRISNPNKQKKILLPPEFAKNMRRKNSEDFQEEAKTSQAFFLKKMPLFNQYEQESNFSQIRLSEIPKKQLDYQEDSNDEELSVQSSKRLIRKSSSSDPQSSIDRTSEVLTKGLKRFKSIDIINEESGSSPGNSLNGSKKMEQKGQMASSLIKTNFKDSQQKFGLQPIQQYNRQKNGITESSSSHSKTNESGRLTRQLEQMKKNHVIEMNEVQSEKSFSKSDSQKSYSTIHLKNQVQDFEDEVIGKISIIREPKNIQLHEADKKLITNMNERFQRIKDMKEGKNQHQQNRKSRLSTKKVTFSTNEQNYAQKSTQTDPFQSKQIPQPSLKEIHKRYEGQISRVQRQNIKIHKELSMNTDTIKYLEGMKQKYEEQNNFLTEKIKRLESILEKNEKQLTEWKEFAKEGRIEPSQTAKENKMAKEINAEWRKKEDTYLSRIAQLEKQLQKANSSLQSMYHSSNNESSKSLKYDHKYRQHIDRLQQYEESLKRNMEIIKQQQEKIIQEWRLVDQFHLNMRQHAEKQKYEYQTIQRDESPVQHMNKISFRAEQDQYIKDNDVASISAKLKSMRSQLARNSR